MEPSGCIISVLLRGVAFVSPLAGAALGLAAECSSLHLGSGLSAPRCCIAKDKHQAWLSICVMIVPRRPAATVLCHFKISPTAGHTACEATSCALRQTLITPLLPWQCCTATHRWEAKRRWAPMSCKLTANRTLSNSLASPNGAKPQEKLPNAAKATLVP